MPISIINIGNRPPSWVTAALDHYQLCIRPFDHIKLKTLPNKPIKNKLIEKKQDTERLLKACEKNTLCIALDVQGTAWNNTELAKHLEQWQSDKGSLTFILGGSEGLDPNLLKAQGCILWSLSPLILPHELARVVVLEQIFRSLSILNHHPYHRPS
jgi:23S rRNA (pseudouridine1915-N3)-methyltransferase